MLLTAMQARTLLRVAAERHFALLAINADSPAALYDCLCAAKQCDAPLMLETSLWQLTGRSFGAGDAARGMARYLADLALLCDSDEFRQVPVAYHTDHIKGDLTFPLLAAAIAGFPLRAGGQELRLRPSTISLDSSQLSEEENIELLCRLAQEGERLRVPVTLEMEAGVDDGVTPVAVTERLVDGVERRHPGQLFLFAPGVGTRHGFSADGYPGFSTAAVAEHCQAASRICSRAIGIALHGSSGLSDAQLAAAVAAGVTKVNWSSDSLHLRAGAAAAYWRDAGPRLERSHREFKATAMDDGVQRAIAATYVPEVVRRIGVLGAQGMAANVRAALAGAAGAVA